MATMTKPSPKQQLFAHLARAGKGIAHPSRLELIEAMAQGEKSVEALSRACGLAFSNVSHHLQILKDCGLAVSRKEGLQVFYAIADPSIFKLCDLVCGSLEQKLVRDAEAFGHRSSGQA